MIIPEFYCKKCDGKNPTVESNILTEQQGTNEFDETIQLMIRSVSTECRYCHKQRIITGVID